MEHQDDIGYWVWHCIALGIGSGIGHRQRSNLSLHLGGQAGGASQAGPIFPTCAQQRREAAN
eukprot:5378218-Pyramimonas_sp.AAC.2